MKKLKLKALELGANEVLTREQLKNVLGGDGSSDGTVKYAACINSTGCWTYTNAVTFQECLADIDRYCSSGSGTCSVNYVCYS